MVAHSKIAGYTLALAMIVFAGVSLTHAQDKDKEKFVRPKIVITDPKPVVHYLHRGSTSERSIKVAKNSSLSLCVNQGIVKVNGWSRDEMRVFVEDGSKFGFKVIESDPKTSEAVWVSVNPIESKEQQAGECIWGGDIEIDMPASAILNIKGKGMTLDVDTIKRASVKSIGGDITLRNIADGISAYAGQGGISVYSSNGRMELESTTGNIVVFEVGPSDIGDILKARANQGSITLQKVGHRQLEINTITGEILYDGSLKSGGNYNFSTSNGSIRLALPTTTSCAVDISYGFGNFSSELKFDPDTEDVAPGPLKRIRGKLGSGGGGTLNLKTTSGRITLVKQ